MTRDEKLVHAFLVADDILSRCEPPPQDPKAPPGVFFGTPIIADPRMPVGVCALCSPNGSIVVKEIAS